MGGGLILILKTRGGGIALRERSRRLIIQFQDSHYLRPPDPSPPAFFRDFSFFLEERVDEFYEWPSPLLQPRQPLCGEENFFFQLFEICSGVENLEEASFPSIRVFKIFKTAPAVCRRHESRPVKFSKNEFSTDFPRARGEDFRRRV